MGGVCKHEVPITLSTLSRRIKNTSNPTTLVTKSYIFKHITFNHESLLRPYWLPEWLLFPIISYSLLEMPVLFGVPVSVVGPVLVLRVLVLSVRVVVIVPVQGVSLSRVVPLMVPLPRVLSMVVVMGVVGVVPSPLVVEKMPPVRVLVVG